MHTDPGSGPMLTAAAAWDGLAADRYVATASCSSAISRLTASWSGPIVGVNGGRGRLHTMINAVAPASLVAATVPNTNRTAVWARASKGLFSAIPLFGGAPLMTLSRPRTGSTNARNHQQPRTEKGHHRPMHSCS
jgi:hypothetical protein